MRPTRTGSRALRRGGPGAAKEPSPPLAWALLAAGLLAGLLAAALPALALPSPAQASLLEEKRAALAGVEHEIDRTQGEIETATGEIDRLEKETALLAGEIDEARREELETRVELADKRRDLGTRLTAYYKENHASIPTIVQLLFDDGDLQDLLTMAPHLFRIAEDDRRLVEEVRNLARGLALQQQELARQRSLLARKQEVLTETRERLKGLLETARQEQGRLQAEVQVLEEADALVRRAQAHRARWRGRVAGSTWALARDFTFPVAGRYAFSNDWGNPRPDDRTHKGTDIMAPYGTPVVACTDGRVDRIEYHQPLGGIIIWLRGDNGNRYYYAHLSAVETGLRIGQRILAGLVIGRVGTSGNAQGGVPHLHFQVHPGGGGPVNPYPVLRISG